MSDSITNRRDFLAGRILRDEIVTVGQMAGDAIIGEAQEPRREPTSGATIRLATSAMATDFAVILNELLHKPIHIPQCRIHWPSRSSSTQLVVKDDGALLAYESRQWLKVAGRTPRPSMHN